VERKLVQPSSSADSGQPVTQDLFCSFRLYLFKRCERRTEGLVKRRGAKSTPKTGTSSNQVRGVLVGNATHLFYFLILHAHMPSLQRTPGKKKQPPRSQHLRINEHKGGRSKPSARPPARGGSGVCLSESGPSARPLPLCQASCSAGCVPLGLRPGLHLSTRLCSRILFSQKNPMLPKLSYAKLFLPIPKLFLCYPKL